MPTPRAGTVGVIINGTDSGTRLNATYAWYDAANADLSPDAIAGPPPIPAIGGPGDGPNLLEWRESGMPFGSEQSKISYSGTIPPGMYLVQKEVREEDPPGWNPWPVGVLAEWGWAGVPTTPGVYNVTVNASSHSGSAGYPGGDFTWTISLAGGCPLITIEPDTIDLEFVGQPIDLTFTAEDGVAPYVWDVAFGELPDGLALSSGGELTGAPTTAGDYEFTIRATDDNGCAGARVYSLSIVEPDPIVVHPDDPTLAPGARGWLYLQLFTATGGVGEPYVFTITDESDDTGLPPGLTLSPGGVLAGLPQFAGLFVFTVRATDVADNFGEREYTLQITGLRIEISDGGPGEPMIDRTIDVSAGDVELTLNRQASATLELGDVDIPARGVDVLIYRRDGITPMFGGVGLVRRVSGIVPQNPGNKIDLDCVDYSIYFDDAVVTLVYTTTQDLEDVITAIVDQALAVYGITYTPTATGKTVPPIEWREITVTDAFKRITDGTGVVFRVLPLKDLDVFTPLDDAAPVTITDAEINAFDLEWKDPPNLPRNTVDLLCGPNGNGIADQHWEVDSGEVSWEVDIQAVLGNAEPAHRANAYFSPVDATNFSAGDTVGVGSSTYTFRASLVGDVAGEVLIGATVEDSIGNLNAAINLAGGGNYAPSTPANADCSSYLRAPDILEADALTVGAAGNAIAVTSSHEAVAFWYGEGSIPRSTLQLGSDATGVAGWTQGYVLEDGAVARTISTPADGNGYYFWDVTDGRGTISVGMGAAPLEGTDLELKYLAVFPFHAIAPPGGGSPPIVFRENHPEIVSYADGIALATQILARESADRRELEATTDVEGFLPGQALTVDTTFRGGIDAVFLVATVRAHIVNAELWEYSLTNQQTDEYAGSYVEQWKALTSGGSSSSSAASGTLVDGGASASGDVYTDGRNAFRADQSMGAHKLRFVEDPTDAQDAATKAYADAGDAAALASALAAAVLVDGSNDFTADQSMGGNKLTDLDTPTSADDAATKAYVDASAGGGSGDHGFFAMGGGLYSLAAGPIILRPTGTTLTFIVGIGFVSTGDATVYANVQLTDCDLADARAVINNSLVSFGGQHLFGLVHITGLTAGKDYVATLQYSSRRAAAAIGGGPGPGQPFLVALDFITAIVAASLETAQASSSGTFVDLATAGPSVTITLASDGLIAVIAGDSENRVQTGTSNLGIDVSGATTLAAAAFVQESTNGAQNCVLQGGIMLARQASGSTTFKLQYSSDGGSNTRYARWIAAMKGVFGDTPITFGVSKVETAETTNSTTYVGLTTADTITITTGTSVLVLFSVNFRGSGVLDASVAVDVSGATTIAAADGTSNAKNIGSTTQTWHVGRGVVLTVNAGSNTFKLKYKVSANTGTFLGRVFVVIPLN